MPLHQQQSPQSQIQTSQQQGQQLIKAKRKKQSPQDDEKKESLSHTQKKPLLSQQQQSHTHQSLSPGIQLPQLLSQQQKHQPPVTKKQPPQILLEQQRLPQNPPIRSNLKQKDPQQQQQQKRLSPDTPKLSSESRRQQQQNQLPSPPHNAKKQHHLPNHTYQPQGEFTELPSPQSLPKNPPHQPQPQQKTLQQQQTTRQQQPASSPPAQNQTPTPQTLIDPPDCQHPTQLEKINNNQSTQSQNNLASNLQKHAPPKQSPPPQIQLDSSSLPLQQLQKHLPETGEELPHRRRRSLPILQSEQQQPEQQKQSPTQSQKHLAQTKQQQQPEQQKQSPTQSQKHLAQTKQQQQPEQQKQSPTQSQKHLAQTKQQQQPEQQKQSPTQSQKHLAQTKQQQQPPPPPTTQKEPPAFLPQLGQQLQLQQHPPSPTEEAKKFCYSSQIYSTPKTQKHNTHIPYHQAKIQTSLLTQQKEQQQSLQQQQQQKEHYSPGGPSSSPQIEEEEKEKHNQPYRSSSFSINPLVSSRRTQDLPTDLPDNNRQPIPLQSPPDSSSSSQHSSHHPTQQQPPSHTVKRQPYHHYYHQQTGVGKKMTSPSFEYFRSSFDNVFQILPQGHEKALKKALYNTAANFFVIFASLVVVAVYFVLQAFLRPLLWAVLCGTFLYPFKRTLTSGLRSWLQGLDQSGTPFAAGLVLLPLKSVHDVSEMVSSTLRNHLKLILLGTVGLPFLNLLYYFGLIDSIFAWVYSLFIFLYAALEYFNSIWIWTLVLAYILMVVLYWRPDNNRQIQYLSIPVWLIFILHICSIAGSLSVPILIITAILMVIGYASEIRKPGSDDGTSSEKDPSESPVYAALAMLSTPKSTPTLTRRTPIEEVPTTNLPAKGDKLNDGAAGAGEASQSSGGGSSKDGEVKETRVKNLHLQTKSPPRQKTKAKDKHQRSLSDQCFIALFWAFVLVRLWIHAWVLLLIPIPVVLIILKKVWRRFNLSFGSLLGYCKEWIEARQDVLFPTPIRGFLKLLTSADRKLISILEQSLDSATSILFILVLLFGTALFTFFFVFQVHQESMHLVQVTSNVLNKSVNPEISQWIPNGDAMQKAMDSMMTNAYLYGRDWIASKIRDAVQGRGGNTSHIEKEVLEVWDRLYKSWFAKNTTSLVDKPENLAGGNLTALWSLASKRNGFVVTDVMNFAKSNIGTLMSTVSTDKLAAAQLKQVMDSIWLVLKGNVSLAFSFLTAVLSLLFGGGTALLNFIISAAIFLTTLFYLLASSGDQYKPVQWFTTFAPMQGGNSIGQAVEDAVSGVFMASLKMAAFYGLYTWLTHTIFSVNIVFIPSALAAVFGAIPFLGTYWAVIPAVLELWLVNREGLQAILLIVAHLLPTYVVDTAIYSEIKGGHPYMTGLSIAGGIYCLGLEGALIGPIVLCFLIAAISIYGNMLRGGDSEPSASNPRAGGVLSDSRAFTVDTGAPTNIGESPSSPMTGILLPWPPELQLPRSLSTEPMVNYHSSTYSHHLPPR